MLRSCDIDFQAFGLGKQVHGSEIFALTHYASVISVFFFSHLSLVISLVYFSVMFTFFFRLFFVIFVRRLFFLTKSGYRRRAHRW